MPAGRPALYTPELAAKVCERLTNGESLRRICKDDEMPCAVTVWTWLDKHPEFAKQYARAREAQAEYYADEIVDISDAEEDARSRAVKIDARKWVASKLRPKRYGELVKHEHGGADGAPIPVSITVRYERPPES